MLKVARTQPTKGTTIAATALVVILHTSVAQARPPTHHAMSPGSFIRKTAHLVIVGQVRALEKKVNTNGSPPIVDFAVKEILRGKAPTGRLKVRWKPLFSGIDTIGGPADARYAAWKARRMEGPAPGSRWILVGPIQGKYLSVPPVGRIKNTAGKRDWAAAEARKGQAMVAAKIRWKRWGARELGKGVKKRVRRSSAVCSANLDRVSSARPRIMVSTETCFKGVVRGQISLEVPKRTWKLLKQTQAVLGRLSVFVFLSRTRSGYRLASPNGILDESAYDAVAPACGHR
jgi:hypothetical protein